MICVDTSALVAILAREDEAAGFASLIVESGDARVAVPNALEYVMVASGQRFGFTATQAMRLIDSLGISLVAFSPALLEIAIDAFARFGKGRSPAGLNFGDCMAYALAKSLDAPLLFKGDDFERTDIKVAAT